MTVTSAEAPARGHAQRAWRAVTELQLLGELQSRFPGVAGEYDLAPSSVKALLRLSGSRPTPMRDLAVAFACDASYITAVVDALEQRGLATREPHPTDRRIRTVVLTPRGEELSAEIFARLSEPPAAIAALSADEQRTLADLLQRVADADVRLAEHRKAD